MKNLMWLLKSKFENVRFIQTPKGERYIGVAAASIVARFELNKWFDKQNSAGLNLVKGASDNVNRIGKNILLEFGEDNFNKIAKIHFKNTIKIRTDISNT